MFRQKQHNNIHQIDELLINSSPPPSHRATSSNTPTTEIFDEKKFREIVRQYQHIMVAIALLEEKAPPNEVSAVDFPELMELQNNLENLRGGVLLAEKFLSTHPEALYALPAIESIDSAMRKIELRLGLKSKQPAEITFDVSNKQPSSVSVENECESNNSLAVKPSIENNLHMEQKIAAIEECNKAIELYSRGGNKVSSHSKEPKLAAFHALSNAIVDSLKDSKITLEDILKACENKIVYIRKITDEMSAEDKINIAETADFDCLGNDYTSYRHPGDKNSATLKDIMNWRRGTAGAIFPSIFTSQIDSVDIFTKIQNIAKTNAGLSKLIIN